MSKRATKKTKRDRTPRVHLEMGKGTACKAGFWGRRTRDRRKVTCDNCTRTLKYHA